MFLSLGKFDSIMSGKLDNDILIGNFHLIFIGYITVDRINFNMFYIFYLDIIGQAIEVGEIRTLQCGGKEKKKIEFQLRDIRLNITQFAEDMESHREEAQFGFVVCLIHFAKIGSFRGNI